MWVLLNVGDVIREGDEVEGGGGNGYSWGDAARMSPVGKRAGTDLIVRRKLTGWEAVKHAIKAEVLGNDKEGCETTSWAWDCECQEGHIHNRESYCPKCDTAQDTQPDSRKAEVILKIIEEK